MTNDDAFEVSGLVWLDDETDDWMFSLWAIHSDSEEDLLEWGAFELKKDAVESLQTSLNNYFSGI